MSEQYKKFAQKTYKTFEDGIKNAVVQSKGSVLVIVTEQHRDTDLEMVVNTLSPPKDHEPAITAAYSHISALAAASKLAGRDKIALSVEMPADILSNFLKAIKENSGKVPERFMEFPTAHAIAYAQNKGIKIVPADPLGAAGPGINPEREEAMQESISAIVTGGSSPKVVVHIGGFAHLPMLQGHNPDDIISSKGQLKADPQKNPFRKSYEQTLYFNTHRLSAVEEATMRSNPENNPDKGYEHFSGIYITKPENAVQIDAPGKAYHDDITNIAARVDAAAAATSSDALAPANARSSTPLKPF